MHSAFRENLDTSTIFGVTMTQILNTLGATAALLLASTSDAHAVLELPEPGSLALTGLGLAAAVYFLRKGRK